jgi:hypothetical protein
MKAIKQVTIVFLIAGIFCGIISYYSASNFKSPLFSAIIPFIIYFLLLPPFKKKMKIKTLIYNSFITFILFWLIAWLTLYAL